MLVEGYTDVLALHQAGVRNAAGIMGTSLTREQVARLVRLVGVLELCLDADRAGEDAMVRAAELAAASKLELRVVAATRRRRPRRSDRARGRRGAEGADRPLRPVRGVRRRARPRSRRLEQRRGQGPRDRASCAVAGAGPGERLRDELAQQIAGALEPLRGPASDLLAAGAGAGAGGAAAGGRRGSRSAGARSGGTSPGPAGMPEPAAPALDQALRGERSFLALCIALPTGAPPCLRRSILTS